MIGFVLSDLRRLWAGSLVVVLLVALATGLGVAVTLQERAIRLGSARAADRFDLVIGAAGSETQLVLSSVFLQPSPLPLMPGTVLAKLAADPRVAWAAPIGFGDSFSGYPIVGTTTALIANATGGFAEGAVFAAEGDAVIGSAVTLPLGAEIKPMHGAVGGHTHTEIAYHVTGRLKPTGTAWDRAILVPIQAVWHLHGLGDDDDEAHDAQPSSGEGSAHEAASAANAPAHAEDHDHHGGIDADAPLDETWSEHVPGLPAVLVKPKTIADAYKLRQEYRSGATLGIFPGEVLTNLYATLGDVKQILVAVATGAQVLVAASLLLVTVMHIGQRRRQIGALRAFGAPRISVFCIVWLELVLLFAAGIGAGFALGYAAALVAARVLTEQSGIILPVEFAGADARIAALLCLFAAILAGLPAVLAYRQSPAAALRS